MELFPVIPIYFGHSFIDMRYTLAFQNITLNYHMNTIMHLPFR